MALPLSLLYLKDLEASNVEDSDEVLTRQSGVQGRVDATHQPLKHTVVGGFGQGRHCKVNLHTHALNSRLGSLVFFMREK